MTGIEKLLSRNSHAQILTRDVVYIALRPFRRAVMRNHLGNNAGAFFLVSRCWRITRLGSAWLPQQRDMNVVRGIRIRRGVPTIYALGAFLPGGENVTL